MMLAAALLAPCAATSAKAETTIAPPDATDARALSRPATLSGAARARRPARAGLAQGRTSRPYRPAVALRDSPQELLPAPESLNRARLETPRSPRAACLAAARRAEQVHDLPPGLLVAVALSESGLHAHAINLGGRSYHPRDLERARAILAGAPRGATLMVGCVQVNARVHARGSDWPLDPLRATDWAGGMLHRWYQETGDWADALRRWHGGSPRSAHALLCRVRAKLEVANPDSAVLQDYPCEGTMVARLRREAQELLEVAEAPDDE
jgi:hypothetical protein